MAVSIALLNLILQTIAYIILIAGFRFARRGDFKKHGTLMAIATLLTFISLISVMLPVFYSIASGIPSAGIDTLNLITIIHHSLGMISFVMAIVAIASLRPCGSIMGNKKFGGVRRYMRSLFILWSISYFTGVIIYLMFYYSI